ncbi:hypothetical protein [Mangrovactinospora gilvigrisea]|uniref:hypothetical protein n=1 Tax=Mangrovactinospora gilvigrisea TaxID=1428644 RepID=UPI000AFF24AA|nr:hypothetical protein [Mangrovactinospora gilvigrisea]
MDIQWAAALLFGPVILALSAVVISILALRGTASKDRAGILRAVAELVRGLRGRP